MKYDYLIVKVEWLSDQYETDADRRPMFMTNDYKADSPKDYSFEVYKLQDDGTFILFSFCEWVKNEFKEYIFNECDSARYPYMEDALIDLTGRIEP